MNDDIRAFGARLRAHRRAAGLSQQELAERAGLSIRAISNLERGRTRSPYRDSLVRLADSLSLTGGAREEFLAAGRHTEAQIDAHLGIPRHLPAPVPGFVGRADSSAALSRLLPPIGDTQIAAISGTPGVGKTALAVHWAHQVAPDFPDGQLYVNLRGYDAGPPRSPADALAGLLRALGVDPERIPDETDERAALFRSVLADRRVLLLLDNARDAEQVRPLLPGAPGSAVIVTSRDALAGLIARDGAARVELPLLPPEDAETLLRTLIGSRADAEPEALQTLVAQCCRLPLALRIAAELVVTREGAEISELVAELSDLRRRLDVLDAGGDPGTAVRAVLSWSYRQLDPSVALALRMVALHPGADFGTFAAAALVRSDVPTTRRMLDRLARAYLVHPVGPDRYELHDLLRSFAREQGEAEDVEAARQDALEALYDYYLGFTAAAMDLRFPVEAGRRPKRSTQAPAAPIAVMRTADEAQSWLDAERSNLTAVVAFATVDTAGSALEARAIELSATVERYLNFGHHLADAIAVQVSALRAARRGDDRKAEATALTHLGFVEWERGRHRQATDYQRQALALFREIGDEYGQGRVLHRLALVERALGNFEAARANAEQVLTACRRRDDKLGQARALHLLGTLSLAQSRFPEAQSYLRESLALLDELTDQRSRSVTLKELGVIELRFGRVADAADYFRQAQALCQDAGNRSGEAEAMSQLGLVQLRYGRTEAAIDLQERALSVFREIEDRHGESEVLTRYALTEVQSGRPLHAIGMLEPALQLARQLGARPVETTVLNSLGEALLAADRADRAPARHLAAAELAEQTGDIGERARARHGLANAHAALGHRDRAVDHARAALAMYTEMGLPEAAVVRTQFSDLLGGPAKPVRLP